jgi:hypothetical protein
MGASKQAIVVKRQVEQSAFNHPIITPYIEKGKLHANL